MIKKILWIIRKNTLTDILRVILNNVYVIKAKSFKNCKELTANKVGLEIGGPSKLFSKKGLMPLYPYIKTLDNCNFSSQTVWEGQIEDGYTYKFDDSKSLGYQYVIDTTDLNKIASNKYDFILSSHVIEHIANPIKALFEWIRILKNEGILLIVLPHKDGTFDHKRNVTPFMHLIEDYNNQTDETDLTHLDEILKFHDLSRDSGVGSFNQFKIRSLNNIENRCLHHHVFNTQLAIKLIDYLKLQILKIETVYPNHIIIVAQKSTEYNNQSIIGKLKNGKFRSPFKSDYL